MSVTVTALSNISHDGQDYVKGDSIDVTKDQAAALVEAGVATKSRAEAAQEAKVVEQPPVGDGLDDLGFKVLKDRAIAEGFDITELKSKDALRGAIRAKAAQEA